MRVPTIIITGFADVRMAVEAMKGGAIEFLEKPFRTQELCDLVQKAIRLDAANWESRQQRERVRRQLAMLSSGEKEVLDLVIAGKTNLMISQKLGLSIRTIEDRRARLMRKLGVNSRTELIELTGAGAMSL